jgi:subtilisin-like proprotein convertase family protein
VLRQGGGTEFNTAATPREVLETSLLPYQGRAVAFAVTPPARELPIERAPAILDKFPNFVETYERENDDTINEIVPGAGAGGALTPFRDPLLANNRPFAPLAMPGPLLNFDGPSSDDRAALFGNRVMPPDTQGDVGLDHYVSMVNGPVAIYNKTTGVLSVPRFKLSALFASLPAGNLCRVNDNGDPIVLYDTLAQRWMISQFALASSSTPPWFECIAVSQTPDPTGAWFVWAFQTPDNGGFPDYPKIGIWRDAYYMTTHQNGFLAPPSAAGRGTGFFAFDRARLLAGDPAATFIYFDRPTAGEGGILPSDIDGINPPPVGVPQTLIRYTADEFGGTFTDAVLPYEFRPDFASPAASTLTVLAPVPVAAFDARQPSGRADIEQPAPALATQNLDSLNDRAMFRVSYRNLGTQAAPVNSYTMNWGVNVSGAPAGTLVATTFTSGVRWVELRRDGAGAITVRDQGTHAAADVNGATGVNFWMPHIAQDVQGNIALGYSEAGTGRNASLAWAGRTGAAATGTLNEGSAVVHSGTGVQLATNSRWGDYSSMSIDPVDDCTFFYHNEYRLLANDNISTGFAWNTRIASFKYPTCTAGPRGTLNVTVTSCATSTPIPGALVSATGGYAATTNASGVANFPAVPGTYSVSASLPNTNGTPGSATVTDATTTNVGLCLNGVPVVIAGTAALVAESILPPNGAMDPGEIVTVDIPVTNTGLANSTNLIGTLAATGGVTSPGAPQSFGVVTVAGPAVTRPFTFTVDPALTCGGTVTLSIAFADGANNFGTRTFVFRTGVVTGSSTQTTSYTEPAVAVPDNVAAGVNLTLPVSGAGGAITDVDFRFDAAAGGTCDATVGNVNAAMDHTFIGDLVFKLTAPGGTAVTVVNSRGGTRENICTTVLDDDGGFPALSTVSSTTGQFLSGNFAPDAALSAFDGGNANGNWVLNVADIAGADTGFMRRFSLLVTSESRTCAAGVVDAVFANGFE